MAKEFANLEVGYDVPALPGMAVADIQTPCLILDLDALERNIRKLGDYAKAHGMRHRAHGKMHKSVDVLRLQQDLGGAVGVCCQKVSEAEVFARSGVAKDILVSNQVRDPLKIDRLARLPKYGVRVSVCVDDIDNVAELSAAASRHGTVLDCLVEVDCGAARCGVTPAAAVEIAQAIVAAPALEFAGIQAYQGSAQHREQFEERKSRLDAAVAIVKETIAAFKAVGLEPKLVSGGGTGTYQLESTSGVFNELQCGSYAFMDAHYGRIYDESGTRLDVSEWENALFILTSVMSHVAPDKAVCDAGLKAQSVDSGLPVIHGRNDVTYFKCSDEHGEIKDPHGVLKINEKLRLIPGHCDPTCNVHDWYVGVRGDRVETLWPISARGKAF